MQRLFGQPTCVAPLTSTICLLTLYQHPSPSYGSGHFTLKNFWLSLPLFPSYFHFEPCTIWENAQNCRSAVCPRLHLFHPEGFNLSKIQLDKRAQNMQFTLGKPPYSTTDDFAIWPLLLNNTFYFQLIFVTSDKSPLRYIVPLYIQRKQLFAFFTQSMSPFGFGKVLVFKQANWLEFK